MAYSYKGAISFGLIYIPITLHNAIKNNDISFNLLDKKTKSRIQYKKTCLDCHDKAIKQEDIIKGYEYEKGKYVLFSNEDFEKIKSQKDNNITIEQFVDLEEIDPLFYDKAYYVVPVGAEKAFNLLKETMEQENKVGIAKCVMGTKENLIALRVDHGDMVLNTLFFYEELQVNPMKKIDTKIDKKELQMAKLLIESMSKPFDIKEYKDDYKIRIEKAIKMKIQGKEITKVKEKKEQDVSDIMEALKKSINQIGKKQAKKKISTIKPKSNTLNSQSH